jgi:hypothetical protein
MAAKFVKKFVKSGPIPIPFRNTYEPKEELRCHYVARIHWWEQYPQNGEAEFERREIDECVRKWQDTCCYSVENVRKIHPFSITRLRKLCNNLEERGRGLISTALAV